MVKTLVQGLRSWTFWKMFGYILVPEAVTLVVIWLLLNSNASSVIHEKTERARVIAQTAATSADWSLVDKVPKNRTSPLYSRYADKLDKISKVRFKRLEGEVYLATIDHGEEYDISPGDQIPIDAGTPDPPLARAYVTRKATYSTEPISNNFGTYVAAYTPILRGGKTIGAIAAEYDSAPLADFQASAIRAFLYSIIPAVLLSIVVALFLASRFVEPMEVFRTIESARSQLDNENWNKLTAREREVAAYSHLTIDGIAEAMGIGPETVKEYLKRIKEATNWSKSDLVLQAFARRLAGIPPFSP